MPNISGKIGRSFGRIVSSRRGVEPDSQVIEGSVKAVQDSLAELIDDGFRVTSVKRGQNRLEWYDPALLHGYVMLKLQRSRYGTQMLDFELVQVGDAVQLMEDVDAVLEANHAAGISDELDEVRLQLPSVEMRVVQKDSSDETIECDVAEHGLMWFAASGLTSAEAKYVRLDLDQDGLHIQVEEQESKCQHYRQQTASRLLGTAAPAAIGVAGVAGPAAVLPAKLLTSQAVLPMAARGALEPVLNMAAHTSGAAVGMQVATTELTKASAGSVMAPTVSTALESMLMPGLAIEGSISSLLLATAALPMTIGIVSTACHIGALTEKYVMVNESSSSLQRLHSLIPRLIDRRHSVPHWNCNHFADAIFEELVDPCLFSGAF
eukprot:TRINITY_DN67241_c0_g1_i1.p1 TRINITY_DN67241_c0_g1~~TRINITY_DN67241_c0_g1_i1.p1  ORF type:complete len:378 (-),score=79.87 TRINITY_DN67241_c0_g1_i1:17-1150(-)